jgi:hypothetical protein
LKIAPVRVTLKNWEYDQKWRSNYQNWPFIFNKPGPRTGIPVLMGAMPDQHSGREHFHTYFCE